MSLKFDIKTEWGTFFLILYSLLLGIAHNPCKMRIFKIHRKGDSKRQGKPKWQSEKDNPETPATYGTQDTGQINVREYQRGNQKWTIQRH